MRTRSGTPAQAAFPVGKVTLAIAVTLGTFALPALAAESGDTITVVGSGPDVAQESAWGPAATVAAKRSATGTKTDTPLVKTPQSVSVVTSDELEMRQPDTVKEALSYTPGVFASRGSSDILDAVAIRGFTNTNTNQYLDGIKLQGDNYSEVSMDPYFLERVEVLRGPSSVLYGKSNPGGLVSMVSKRPTTETLREVQFSMGTDNLYQTGFDFGGAIDDAGVYSYRLTGLARSQDAQQAMSQEKRYAIAPSFTWHPDDNTTFTFLSNFQNDPEAGYYGWLPRQGTVVPYTDANGNQRKLPVDFTEGEQEDKFSRNQKMVGYSFGHAFNDTWTVRQNLRYTMLSTHYIGHYGNGYVAPATIQRNFVDSSEKLNNFDVDTQAQAKFATGQVDHTLLMGVDYMRMRNDINADYALGTVSSINMTAPQYGNDGYDITYRYHILNRQEQTGLYVQDQAEWNHWLLTLGGRYDFAKTTVLTRSSGATDKDRDEQFTWRGGLNYLFDNGISPYFSYSESFEPVSGATKEGKSFDPSHGKQYEAGVKYIPEDRPISLTAAVYQLTKDNNLTADPAPDSSAFSVQSGEIRSRGVELEAKAAVNANINLTASYTFTDAEYTKDTNLKGQRPVEVPRNMASLWADYTFHETALSGLTIGSGVRYVGATNTIDAANQQYNVAAYTLVDATVKYDLARVGLPGSTVGLNINNLFDREYVSSCYRDYACYWGSDRQIVATATFRF